METLDLTGNLLKDLPGSLPAELGALKRVKMDLSLFTRLPDEVVAPLLDRPGFSWELAHANRSCAPYRSQVPPSDPALPLSEVEAIVQPTAGYRQMEIRAWAHGVYLVAVWREDGNLDLFAISKGADQHWSLLARAEHPVVLMDDFSFMLDLAPYRLSSSELGFGLRRIGSANVPSNLIAYEEELQVFRIHGDKIEQILKTVVYTRHEKAGPPPGIPDTGNEREWHWEEETCAVIAVARSKTHGSFNWVKAQSGNSSRPPSEEERPSIRFPAAVLRWTGERYEAKSDPTHSIFFKYD